jgi:hypothetical protein
MSTFLTASSSLTDDAAAARAAVATLFEGLAGQTPSFVVAFATDGRDLSAVRAVLADAWAGATIVGASAPALFVDDVLLRDGVSVMAVVDASLAVQAAVVDGIAAQGRAAGEAVTEAVTEALEASGRTAAGPHTALLLLSDGIVGNSVEVARGVVEVAGRELRMFGGGTGDDFKFAQTFQLAPDGVHQGAALAVGLSASAPIGVALRHGCTPWGPPMQATGTSDRAVRSLDFEPAFPRYQATVSSLGEVPPTPEGFMAYAMLHPLGIVQGQDDHILRSPLAVSEDGGMVCCSDIPSHALVRLMRGTPASLVDAAEEAAAAARAQLGATPAGAALVFACISRDVVLDARDGSASRELAGVRRGLGADIPVFGCMTFGGFGALSSGLGQYHSKSVNVCVLPAGGGLDA